MRNHKEKNKFLIDYFNVNSFLSKYFPHKELDTKTEGSRFDTDTHQVILNINKFNQFAIWFLNKKNKEDVKAISVQHSDELEQVFGGSGAITIMAMKKVGEKEKIMNNIFIGGVWSTVNAFEQALELLLNPDNKQIFLSYAKDRKELPTKK
jgi:hypothetical protein